MSETLPPAALAAVTSAAAGRQATTPRAVRHFGFAAMEARAARSGGALRPPPAPPAHAAPDTAPPRPVKVRLWLPLTVLSLLLAPFALLLALPFYLVPPRWRPDPILAALRIGQVLLSLGGTVVDVRTRDAIVAIKIY